MPFCGWFTLFIFAFVLATGIHLGWTHDKILPPYLLILFFLITVGYFVGAGAHHIKEILGLWL